MTDILVWGATGFTGRLVCAALAKRGLAFTAGGRSSEKLDAIARRHGCDVAVADLKDADSIVRAIRGRKVVLACAGPFMEIGEPVLATAAREGAAYADTTGEQRFVADMFMRYRATAEARRVCIAPSLAYEVAPADWAAHVAANAVGGSPDAIAVGYLLGSSSRGGYGPSTTRGTKRSALKMMADDRPMQFVNGALTTELVAESLFEFESETGKRVVGVSFPSPEAILTPGHTGARTVRTFMVLASGAASSPLARGLRAVRPLVPALGRALHGALGSLVDRTSEGPDERGRDAAFEVVAVATKGAERATARVSGRDPYGLTAEIQALFAARVLSGDTTAVGFVAPSVAIPPADAFAALSEVGLRCSRA